MDLAIEEVSELLDVPEITLIQWIKEGEIPAYLIDNTYRLDRYEVEAWVLRQKNQMKPTGSDFIENAHFDKKKKGQEQFNLFRALHKGNVYHIDAPNKYDAISQTVAHIAKDLSLDPEILTELFIEREHLASTALGKGFAIPHAREILLKRYADIVSVVFLKNPIPYDALDGQAVHTLFFLLASDDKKHLGLLSKIAHLTSSDAMCAFLSTKPSKAAFLEQVKHWEATLSPQ